MPRTSIAVATAVVQDGINPVPFVAADAANDMKFENTGREILIVRNSSGVAVQVTINSVADEAGRTGNIVESVAAGNHAVFPFLRPAWWNQRSGSDQGTVTVDFDVDTAITVAVLRIPHTF